MMTSAMSSIRARTQPWSKEPLTAINFRAASVPALYKRSLIA